MSMLVSILIPAYNSQDTIYDSLLSCLNQVYRPLEVVVVDDGSVDETYSVVNDFVSRFNNDDFIVKIYSIKNAGQCNARNVAFNYSTGHAITYLDADDVYHPERISILIEALMSNGAEIAYSKYKRFASVNEIDFNGGFKETKYTSLMVSDHQLIKFEPAIWQ